MRVVPAHPTRLTRDRRPSHRHRRRADDQSGAVKVALIVAEPTARRGLEATLGDDDRLLVVGTAPGGGQAIALVAAQAPDVCVVFVGPAGDELRLARHLTQLAWAPRVLVHLAGEEPELTAAAVVAGADGVVSGDGALDELGVAIRRLAAGRRHFPAMAPEATRGLAQSVAPGDRPVVAMLVHGTHPDDIANVLGTSARWLNARRWAILEQLPAARHRRTVPGAQLGAWRTDHTRPPSTQRAMAG